MNAFAELWVELRHMSKVSLVLVALLLIGLLALSAHAQDAQRGRQLYEMHCVSCHYERIHSRDPSRSTIKSRTALRVEAGRWAAQVKRSLSTEDVDDIAEYLNRSHYRFEN